RFTSVHEPPLISHVGCNPCPSSWNHPPRRLERQLRVLVRGQFGSISDSGPLQCHSGSLTWSGQLSTQANGPPPLPPLRKSHSQSLNTERRTGLVFFSEEQSNDCACCGMRKVKRRIQTEITLCAP